jgi:LysW-gamma-L-lysine carboxypeptidase
MAQPQFTYASSDAVEFLKDILWIESLSGREGKLSHYLTKFLEAYNFHIIPSAVGNVIGVKGQGKPVLLLASHMDTVPTENPYREEGDLIYATGAVDCKPSLASIFFSAATAEWKEEYGTLIVAGLVNEETDDLGMAEFFKLDVQPDFAIFGEPTKSDRICLGYRGRVWIQMKVTAETGHTAASWDYENSIDVFYTIYKKIADMINGLNKDHLIYENGVPQEGQHFHELSVVLSTIHAGQESNVMAKKCEGDLDFRIPLWITPEELLDQLKSVVSDVYQDRKETWKRPIHVDLWIKSRTNPCLVNSEIPLVQALRWATFKETGRKVTTLRKTGTTYTNNMMEFYGLRNPKFRCITYGPGDPRLEHTDNEFISKTEYLESINSYLRFFPKFFEILNRGISSVEASIKAESSAIKSAAEVKLNNW